MSLPTDAKQRKNAPLCRGCLDYFPDAWDELARVLVRGVHLEDTLIDAVRNRGKTGPNGRYAAIAARCALMILEWEISGEEPTVKYGRPAIRLDPPELDRRVLRRFPNALMAVAELSRIGNEQHNPGEPMHWAKEKSTDEPDALLRHLAERGTLDTDGQRHSAKVAWRALAGLQREIDAEKVKQQALEDARDRFRARLTGTLNPAAPVDNGRAWYQKQAKREFKIGDLVYWGARTGSTYRVQGLRGDGRIDLYNTRSGSAAVAYAFDLKHAAALP
jgi:hypothetical protein